MDKKTKDLYEFGDFRLDPQEKVLYRKEKLLTLAPKVFDTLEVLIRSEGRIISKEDLMDAVWPDAFVEESNLTQNIYTLRQVFGKRNKFIETVPRRGYRFSAEVKTLTRNGFAENGESVSREIPDEMIVARRTRTEIIEEEVFDDEREKSETPALEGKRKFSFSKKFYAGAIAGILFLLVIGLAGFSLWNRDLSPAVSYSAENVRLTALTDTGDVTALAVSPDKRFLAYTVNSSGAGEKMRLRDLELGQDVSLKIPRRFRPTFMRFSPDGDFIYFSDGKGSADVYKITRFGGKAELIVRNVASEFSFSRDEKKIAFIRRDPAKNDHTLIVRDLETGVEKEILKKKFPEGFSLISSPAFLPSGEKIYVLTARQKTFFSEVAVIDLKTLRETPVKTPNRLKHFIQIEATPREDEVIVSVRENSRFGQVYKLSVRDGKVKRITNDLENYRKISVSADGKSVSALKILNYSNLWLLPGAKNENARQLTRGTFGRYGRHGLELLSDGRITFVSVASGNREIWTLDLRDNSLNQLTRDESAISQNPVSAPNSRHIYFVSGKNRSRGIGRMDLDGKNQISLTSDIKSKDLSPTLSPDEKSLFFIRQTSGKNSLMQMNLSVRSLRTLDLPERIIPGGFLKVSPDGRMLAFHQVSRPGQAENAEQKAMNVIVISLDGTFSKPKVFRVDASRPNIRWTPTSEAFDFIENSPTTSFIKRLTLSAPLSTETVAEIKNKKIQNFIWLSDRKDLLISDRIEKQDAVLITDFH